MTLAVALAAPHPGAAGAARTIDGNAFDAALAAAAALTVVYPHQCSIGGDLVAIVRPAGRPPRAVLSIGAAAAATDVEALRAAASDGEALRAAATNVAARRAVGAHMPVAGPQTVTVPGVVAGWAAIAELGATRPLRELLGPAIALAEKGVAVSPGLRRAAQAGLDVIRADPGLTALLMDGDRLRDHLVQPALARTLTSIAEDWRSFYDRSPLVEGLRKLGSALTGADFAAHRAEVVDPLSREVDGVVWSAAPPPVQGATFLDLVGSGTLLADAWRARAARDAFLGDPRTGPIDLDGLLPHHSEGAEALSNKSGISELRDEKARGKDGRGERARGEDARGANARSERARGERASGEGAWGERANGDTVAVSAVDSAGNAVTLIQSVFFSFGAGLLDPATGVVLHNRGSSFSLDPAHPGRIRGGSRPPHTLCPTIAVTRDGVIALGCQGGRSQPWILAQVAADVVGARDLNQLVGRPRWVIGAGEIGRTVPTLLLEPGLAAEAGDYAVESTSGPHDDAGHVQVARLRGDVLDAGSDPRADGVAVVLRP
ncbi:gamma-glutamyltransferase [Actinoplanes sp. NPDC048988]|uniref:gamma-glutamyltransferase n=1 Tax=Actinoplanes sp. NPDC048988 TaxID=3363901 RepID=UPI003722F798